MNKPGLKATSLRSIMITIVIVLIIVCATGFYITQTKLSEFSKTVITSIIESKSGTTSSEGLQALEAALIAKSTDIENADKITSSSENYQSQAIIDLTNYATQTNISISDFSVMNASEVNSSSIPIDGVDKKYLKISFSSSVIFGDFVKFLKLIETSTPKMQALGVSISQSQDSRISIQPMIIELYAEK